MTIIIQTDRQAVDEMIVSKSELVAKTGVVKVDGDLTVEDEADNVADSAIKQLH